jgi:cytochrome b involved in lipid metabolism
MMKRIVTVCLIIFWTAYVAIVAVGLAKHEESNEKTGTTTTPVVDTKSLGQLTLDATEVAKHANENSCWMIIDSKVYDITAYFGTHPGGNPLMLASCGKDATQAFKFIPHRHSAYAASLLAKYLLGNVGETINQDTTPPSTSASSPTTAPSKAPATTNYTYTLADVSTHNKAADCWLIVDSKVYNITTYFGSHPGGNPVMLTSCGNDATQAFKLIPHKHSSYATTVLANYYIGVVGATTNAGSSTVPPVTTNNTNYSTVDGEEEDD